MTPSVFPNGFLYFLRSCTEHAAVIGVLQQHNGPVTVADVAKAVALPSMQVSGILRTCEYAGVVSRGKKVSNYCGRVNTYELRPEIRRGLEMLEVGA